jgi:alpha/beta superfamily hydrolase
MYLIVCISGDGGGSQGPDGAYQSLKERLDPKKYHVFPIETIPKNIDQNVDYICHELEQSYTCYEKIFLIGWSLGTVVAVNVVYQLRTTSIRITGLILISAIRKYMENFPHIVIPIGFIHGELDQVSKFCNSQILYDQTYAIKRLIKMDSCDHLFEGYGYQLVDRMIDLIYDFSQKFND